MKCGQVPKWVWIVLVLAHALALAWALRSGHWRFPDSDRYRLAAANLVQHGQLYAQAWPDATPRGQAVQEFTIRPPGYPVVLAVLKGATSPWLVLLVQNGLSLFILSAVLRWWGRRVTPLTKDWLGALVLVLTFPAQIIYANAVMSEVFLQTLLLWLTAVVGAFYQTGKLRYWIGVAVVVTLTLLFKPVCCLLALVVAGTGLVLGWRRREPRLWAIGMLPVVVMGAYMAWNLQRTGYFHFSSITDINLLHYNAAGVVRQVEGPAAEEAWVAGVLRMANAQDNFATRQRLIQQRAVAILLAHPGVYIRQHALGMASFFLDPGRFDVSEFGGLVRPAGGGLLVQMRAGGFWRAIAQLPLGLLAGLTLVLLANMSRLVLAVRGFRRLGKGPVAWRAGRWVAVGLLLYLALLTGPLGAARFLMPAWPLLLGLALMGLRGPTVPPATCVASAASA